MSNAHEVVLAAVVAKLKQAPAIAGGNVERGRRRPVSDNVDQFVAVYFAGSVPQRGSIAGAPIDWSTLARIECFARGRGGVSGDEAALALHASAWERLMSDPSLAGLVMDMEPQPIAPADDEQLDANLGLISGAVLLRHRTAAYTLET